MITIFSRGWIAYFDQRLEKWLWEDGKIMRNKEKPCKRCGEFPTSEGYDACLGYIKGAISACCGHGAEEGYVKYKKDGDEIV